MIHVEKTTLDGVLLVQPEFFEDHRGEYVETYNVRTYREAGININFLQDDYSISNRNVLRGLHGDDKTWKLVSCPYGRFYLVVLDLREGSQTFGKWQSFVLSDRNKRQVLIPPMCANGHLILSDFAIFNYKQSEYYEARGQFTIRYDDSRYNIWWPIDSPILSQRDQSGGYV